MERLRRTLDFAFPSGRRRLETIFRRVKQALDQVIADHGLSNEVILRRSQDLEAVLGANPFPDAVAARPNHMLVLFMEDAPTTDTRPALAQYDGPERVHLTGREVFVDYVEGVARSKLTAARLERILGRPGTEQWRHPALQSGASDLAVLPIDTHRRPRRGRISF